MKYFMKGYLVGNLWGGGEGSYPTREFKGKSLRNLEKEVKRAIKDGSIDSGFGFESIKGAVMNIYKVYERNLGNEKMEIPKYWDSRVYGNLNSKEVGFLMKI